MEKMTLATETCLSPTPPVEGRGGSSWSGVTAGDTDCRTGRNQIPRVLVPQPRGLGPGRSQGLSCGTKEAMRDGRRWASDEGGRGEEKQGSH